MAGDIPLYPALVEGLEWIDLPSGALQVRGPEVAVVLEGATFRSLLPQLRPLLTGQLNLREILSALPEHEPVTVLTAIALLHSRGLLEDGDPAGRAAFTPAELERLGPQLRFFSRYVGATRRAGSRFELQRLLRDARVVLVGTGRIFEDLRHYLAEAGAGRLETIDARTGTPGDTSAPARPDARRAPPDARDTWAQRLAPLVEDGTSLVVTALPVPVPALLEAMCELCVAAGVLFLPAVIDGADRRVGPGVIPMETACERCYAARRYAAAPHPEEEHAWREHRDRMGLAGGVVEWPPFASHVAAYAAQEAIRLLTHVATPATLNRVALFDALTGGMELERVHKLPRCPVCSLAAVQPAGIRGR